MKADHKIEPVLNERMGDLTLQRVNSSRLPRTPTTARSVRGRPGLPCCVAASAAPLQELALGEAVNMERLKQPRSTPTVPVHSPTLLAIERAWFEDEEGQHLFVSVTAKMLSQFGETSPWDRAQHLGGLHRREI